MSINTTLARQRRFPCRPVHRDPSQKHCCVTVDKPPERPDPAMYSQKEQLSIGAVPSWNNPDITTNDWASLKLYQEPEIVVRNLSSTASALNTLVHFHSSPFGIGMPRTLLSSRMVNLPPSSQTTLKFPLSQDILNGPQEIGTYIVLEHPHDQKKINSQGDQIAKGINTSESGRHPELRLPVRNPLGQTQQITLSVLPNDLGAAVTSVALILPPFAQTDTQVTMVIPNTLHGTPDAYLTREVTIIGRDADGQVIDGATFVIRIDN